MYNEYQNGKPGTTAMNEADSNADTCCLGVNFVILSYTSRTADVYPYDTSYEPMKNVPIVSGATTYHHPNGESFILVVHEALYYGEKLNHSLLNPNQIRHGGLGFWDNPYDENHALGIEVYDMDMDIPMTYHGTKLSFKTSTPTDHELNVLPHIVLTSESPWNPHDVKLGEMRTEEPTNITCLKKVQVAESEADEAYKYGYNYERMRGDDALMHEINPIISYIQALNKDEQAYGLVDKPPHKSFISSKRHHKLDADGLAENWLIGPIKAKATLRATTQNFKRSAILPIGRRYRADRFYDMKKLDGHFSTDTIYAEVKSINQHKFAQVYTHKCGFAVVYPIDNMTGDTIGRTLQDFAYDFGIPMYLTFDGHKSQVSEGLLFMRLVRKYRIKFHVSEPRKPEQNPAEGGIRKKLRGDGTES